MRFAIMAWVVVARPCTQLVKENLMRWSLVAVALTAAAMASSSSADEVIFKNGDRLTGTIESREGGKLVIKTAVAGKVTVDVKDVKTMASDRPISLKLKDGTVVHQKVDAGPDGQVALAPGGALQP